jgi:hypothetical protein
LGIKAKFKGLGAKFKGLRAKGHVSEPIQNNAN